MATSEAPLSVPNVMLAVARGAQPSGFIDIDYTLDQVQAIFASMNTQAAPADAIWASSLAPDQSDAELTQTGTEANPYSVRRAIYSATPGKHVLLKDDGIYTQSKVIQTSSQYDEDTYISHTVDDPNIIPFNIVEPTSSSERIGIRGEPGTCPTFDFTSTRISVSLDFLEVSHIRINNGGTSFSATGGPDYERTSQGLWVHHVCGEFFRQTGGTSNEGFFAISDAAVTGGEKPVFEYCVVKGNNSDTNQNNACFYASFPKKFAVRNCYFSGLNNNTVYFKHGNDYTAVGGLETVDITFENNYVSGNVNWAGSGCTIQNNIVTGNFRVASDGGGQATDQKYNTIQNNTVVGGMDLSKLDWDCENNTVKNNIMDKFRLQYEGAGAAPLDPSTNTNASDYNLINAADDGQRFLWDSQFNDPAQYKTLPNWRTYISLDLNSAVQADQLKGLGTYTKLADFELVSGSVGQTLSDTGGAVGADTSLVGIQ